MAKIIQVGLGRWGANWATKIVPSVAAAEAVAYVDSAPAALEAAQEKAGARPEQCFASLAAALAAVECDLVLATPSGQLTVEAVYWTEVTGGVAR